MAAAALADTPSTPASSLGWRPSTAVCHSTACQRSGSDSKAWVTISRSAWPSSGGAGLVAHRLGHLVERLVGGPLALLGRQPPQGHEQVGPERLGRARAPPDGAQDPLEGTVDEVLGIAEAPVRRRQPQGGGLVADVQLREGGFVAGPRLIEELGVGECGDRHAWSNLSASLSQGMGRDQRQPLGE